MAYLKKDLDGHPGLVWLRSFAKGLIKTYECDLQVTWEGPHIWVFSTNLRVLLGPSELNAKRASADSAWAGDDFFYLTASFLQLHHFKLQTWQTPNTSKYPAFMANKYQCSSTRCLPISKFHHFPVHTHTHTRTHMYLCTGDKQRNIYL